MTEKTSAWRDEDRPQRETPLKHQTTAFDLMCNNICKVCPVCRSDDCEELGVESDEGGWLIAAFWCPACGSIIKRSEILTMEEE